jgi:hypothetical protein
MCRRQHLVQHHGERPDIDAVGDRVTDPLLWRHPVRRPDEGLAGQPSAIDARQTEIDHPRASVAGDHDVARLQVTVVHSCCVRVHQRVGDRSRHAKRVVDRGGATPHPLPQ